MSSPNCWLKYGDIATIITKLFPQSKITQIKEMREGIGAIMLRISVKNPSKDIMLRILRTKRKRLFEKELGFIFYAKKFNICPVPNVIFFDDSRELIPNDYYIYDFLKEKILAKALDKLTYHEKETVYRKIGQILGTMHQHRKDHLGDVFFDETNLKFEKRKVQSIYPKIAEDYHWLLENDFAEDKDPVFIQFKSSCEQIFDKYHECALGKPERIGFTHNDLSSDNIIVSRATVPAFIDFSEWGFSDVDWELARCERRLFLWMNPVPLVEIRVLKKAFFEGYQTVNTISADYTKKRPLFFLIQIMDDMGMFPKFCERMNAAQQWQLKETLCWEMEKLIKSCG